MPTEEEWQAMETDPRWTSGVRTWMRKIDENDRLWLVKEREEAVAAGKWELPQIGGFCGRLWLDRITTIGGQRWRRGSEQWYVTGMGQGLDGSTLIRPQCTYEELIARPDAEYTTIEQLDRNVRAMLGRITELENVVYHGQSLASTRIPASTVAALRAFNQASRRAQAFDIDAELGETHEPPPPGEEPVANIQRQLQRRGPEAG